MAKNVRVGGSPLGRARPTRIPKPAVFVSKYMTSFAFEVEKPAKKAVAVVTDANGVEVRKLDVDASALGRGEAV